MKEEVEKKVQKILSLLVTSLMQCEVRGRG